MHPSQSGCPFVKLVWDLYSTESWDALKGILPLTISRGSSQCREYLMEIFLEMCLNRCKDGIAAMLNGGVSRTSVYAAIICHRFVISDDIIDFVRGYGVDIPVEYVNDKMDETTQDTAAVEDKQVTDEVKDTQDTGAVKVNHASEVNTTTHTVGDKTDSLQDEEKIYDTIMEKYKPTFIIVKQLMKTKSLEELKVVLKRCTPEELMSQEMFGLTHWACRELDDNVAQAMIDGGVSPNIRGSDGRCLLNGLSSPRYINTVKLLWAAGFNLLDTVEMGDVFTLACVHSNNNDFVKFMLDKGVSVDIRDQHEKTGMMYAIQRRNESTVKLLLGAGADIYTNVGGMALDTKTFGSMFTAACRRGDNDFVKLMLQKGIPVDIRASNDSTGLMYAAQQGHVSTVELLLEAGADVLLKGESGKTPMHWSYSSCMEIIQKAEAVAMEKKRFGLSEEDYNKLRMQMRAEIESEILDKVKNSLSLA